MPFPTLMTETLPLMDFTHDQATSAGLTADERSAAIEIMSGIIHSGETSFTRAGERIARMIWEHRSELIPTAADVRSGRYTNRQTDLAL